MIDFPIFQFQNKKKHAEKKVSGNPTITHEVLSFMSKLLYQKSANGPWPTVWWNPNSPRSKSNFKAEMFWTEIGQKSQFFDIP